MIRLSNAYCCICVTNPRNLDISCTFSDNFHVCLPSMKKHVCWDLRTKLIKVHLELIKQLLCCIWKLNNYSDCFESNIDVRLRFYSNSRVSYLGEVRTVTLGLNNTNELQRMKKNTLPVWYIKSTDSNSASNSCKACIWLHVVYWSAVSVRCCVWPVISLFVSVCILQPQFSPISHYRKQ